MRLSILRFLTVGKTSEAATNLPEPNAHILPYPSTPTPPKKKKRKRKPLFLTTNVFRTFSLFYFYALSFCQYQPFQFQGTPTHLHLCSLHHGLLALETSERLVIFIIAYTCKHKDCVFALALRVPLCACAEPYNCGFELEHGDDAHVQRVARNSNANAQRLR